jgi:hypothetical protein
MSHVTGMVRTVATAALGTRGVVNRSAIRPRARWSAEQAWAWDEATGWLVGCNFTPSTASNQLELWQAATFDPATIDRELGWAESLGMNSIRLFLHDLLWEVDRTRFLDRVDRVLEIAADHGISVVPVLFDGIWDPDPRPGPQRSPRPGVHNSTWVQGPGAAVLADRSRWTTLRGYVDAVLDRFGDDPRVVLWDLFNEPDSPNPAWVRRDPGGKSAQVADLLEQVWDWAVEAGPAQPLTVGVFLFPNRRAEGASRVARTAVERSDVISFHSYAADPILERTIDALSRWGRPLVCTEWLARPASPAAQLEVFERHGVGAYCWGLVDGRTQTRYPWTSWLKKGSPDDPWFHELLHHDGTPYDDDEAALFRRLTNPAARS